MRAATVGRAFVLSGLYFAQGLPYGVFSQALPVMMRQQGYSLESIGLSNLLALPWVLKFAWAPLVDRVPGPRRRVIVPLNLAAAALFLLLSGVDPRSMVPLLVAVLLCNLVAATQDIATDALAVELLPPGERGIGNGVQVAGYRLGMVAGGGLLVQQFETWGWALTFGVAAGLVVAGTVPLLFAGNPPRAGVEEGSASDALRWDRWFAGREGAAWFGLLVLTKLGDAFGTGMAKPLLVDQHRSLAQIGQWMGLYGSLSSILGALVGGWIVTRISLRRALAAFSVGQAGTLVGWAWIAAGAAGSAPVVIVAEHLVSGMATAALFTAMMGAVRTGRGGTDYTVQASVVVLAQGLGALASGYSAKALGYVGHFGLAAAMTLFAAVWVARLRSRTGRFGLA
jgi:MFS family permease